MKKLVLIIFIAVVSFTAEAQQDRHFSMFFANPVQLNPGAAGHANGDMQLFTNFRTQWFTLSSVPYRSYSAGVDGKLFDDAIDKGFIGAGVNFLNDVSGDGKYTLNVISFPVNYTLMISNNTFLSLGIQPGIYAQKLDETALYFESQWNGGGFNTGASSGEDIGAFNLSRFDLASGIFFNSRPTEHIDYQLGISGFHLTGQKIGFTQSFEKLYRDFIFYGQGNFRSSENKWSFHPAIFGMFQGPNREFTFGNNFEYELKPSSEYTSYFDGMSLSLGIYYRTSDAFITNLIYNAGALSFGVGYDINLSGLTVATNGVGAIEFYLKFTPSFDSRYSAPSIH